MKRNADIFDEDTCPWCSQDYDSAHRRDKALIKPCKHYGCVLCLLRVLRSGKGPHPCKTCGVGIKTFSAVEAESLDASHVRDQEKAQPQQKKHQTDKGKEEEEEENQEVKGEEEEEEELNEEQEIAWLSKQCTEYEPPEDWTCQICSFAYDHLDRQPVKVTKCYAIKKDPYNDAIVDRGEFPGCGHAMCNKCMQQLLTGNSDECYFCRGCVKESAVDNGLLISILRSPAYAALTARNNTLLLEKEITGNVNVLALQEQLRDALSKASQIGKVKQDLAKSTGLLADAKKTLDTANEQLQKTMSMNGTLFDEIIDMRLERQDPGRLGISVTRSGDTIFLNVALQNRTLPKNEATRRVMYARDVSIIGKPAMSAVRELINADKQMTELPTQAEIDASYAEIGDQFTLVERGTWLHRAISQISRTPESILTGIDERESNKTFQKVSRLSLDSALGEYRRALQTKEVKLDGGGGPVKLKCVDIGPYSYRVPPGNITQFALLNIDEMRESLLVMAARRKLNREQIHAAIETLIGDILRGKYQQNAVVDMWKLVAKNMQCLYVLWEVACQEEAPQIFIDNAPECFIRHGIQVPDRVFSKMSAELLTRWKTHIDSIVDPAIRSVYAGVPEYIDTLLSVERLF